MSVVFNSFEVIEIDGIPAGNIVDVISNHASKRADVLAAFGVYVAKLQKEINAEKVLLEADKAKLTTDLAAKTTQYDAEVIKVTNLETEKTTLTTEKTQLTSDLATANATIATLQARIAELEQAVIDLTPPPAPLSITRYQCTTWLRGANMLQPSQSVSDLIRLIVTDPDQQLRALDRWELGTSVLRNDPMIETLGLVLGLSTEQLDAAFLVASQIQ